MYCIVNNSTVYELADIASLCPEEAVIFSNTLTLQLQDIFADIHKPEVVHSILLNNLFWSHCIYCTTIESYGSEVPLPCVFN